MLVTFRFRESGTIQDSKKNTAIALFLKVNHDTNFETQ